VKIKIILPVVLYVCESWFLTLREEQWWRMFHNRILRLIFGNKKEIGNNRMLKGIEKIRSFITCTPREILGTSNQGRLGRWIM
jgi:hypothetical protein